MFIKRKSLYSKVDDTYLHLYQDLEFDPVFIIGGPRSGTTILQHFLGETNAFISMSGFHVRYYDTLISDHLSNQLEARKVEAQILLDSFGMSTRGVDEVPVSLDAPFEYGFIFDRAGYPQYIVNQSIPLLKEACRKLIFLSKEPKPILLKNPSDVDNVQLIREKFPNAKFIVLLRNPIYCINSTVKFCTYALSSKNALFCDIWPTYHEVVSNPIFYAGVRFLMTSEVLDVRLRFFTFIWLRWQKALLDYLKTFEKDPNFHFTSYEKLCQDPNKTLNAIFTSLDIPCHDPFDFTTRIQPRAPKLLPDVEKNAQRLTSLFKPTIDYCFSDIPFQVNS